ncbi:8438_t:CDS:2, partial [Cetraspora pellucida]
MYKLELLLEVSLELPSKVPPEVQPETSPELLQEPSLRQTPKPLQQKSSKLLHTSKCVHHSSHLSKSQISNTQVSHLDDISNRITPPQPRSHLGDISNRITPLTLEIVKNRSYKYFRQGSRIEIDLVLPYIAPEIIYPEVKNRKPHTKPSDIYSFGII